ncbi:hypothetical protein L9F63_018074, partial [Diploptera punctata]
QKAIATLQKLHCACDRHRFFWPPRWLSECRDPKSIHAKSIHATSIMFSTLVLSLRILGNSLPILRKRQRSYMTDEYECNDDLLKYAELTATSFLRDRGPTNARLNVHKCQLMKQTPPMLIRIKTILIHIEKRRLFYSRDSKL